MFDAGKAGVYYFFDPAKTFRHQGFDVIETVVHMTAEFNKALIQIADPAIQISNAAVADEDTDQNSNRRDRYGKDRLFAHIHIIR